MSTQTIAISKQSNPSATVTIQPVDDDVVEIGIRSELTAAVEEPLNRAWEQVDDVRVIMLDLEEVNYLNGYGIALLITLLRHVRERDRHLLAFGASPHCRQILSLVRLDEVIQLFDSRQEALAAFPMQRRYVLQDSLQQVHRV
ncbi:MAG TPA: STAS domain-containing protein [Anaerolineae bacterium]